jgi:hypothetical protein
MEHGGSVDVCNMYVTLVFLRLDCFGMLVTQQWQDWIHPLGYIIHHILNMGTVYCTCGPLHSKKKQSDDGTGSETCTSSWLTGSN